MGVVRTKIMIRTRYLAILVVLLFASNSYSKEVFVHTKDNVKIWSESFGNRANPAILLIMGAMNQSIFWPEGFCEELARSGFYVIRYDHRDTGKSDGFDFQVDPYDLTTLKNDAITVLNSHGVKKAIVVGLSMGGYIAQLIAIENPESVSNLVLISTSADHRPYMNATMGQPVVGNSLPPPTSRFLNYIERSIQSPPTTRDEITSNLIEGWRVTYGGRKIFPEAKIASAIVLSGNRSKNDVMPMNHALAINASSDRLELVKEITAPTLIIHGKYDPCLPLEHGMYLSDNIPNASLTVFDMGHSFQWSWGSEVAAEIISFSK